MTQARIVAIADGLVDALNNASGFSLPFVAVRSWRLYQPEDRLPGPNEPALVAVVPRDIVSARSSRNSIERSYGLAVVVQARLGQAGAPRTDDLVRLVEEIWEFIEPNEQSAGVEPAAAEFVGTVHEGDVLVDDELFEAGVFAAVTTFTFADFR